MPPLYFQRLDSHRGGHGSGISTPCYFESATSPPAVVIELKKIIQVTVDLREDDMPSRSSSRYPKELLKQRALHPIDDAGFG